MNITKLVQNRNKNNLVEGRLPHMDQKHLLHGPLLMILVMRTSSYKQLTDDSSLHGERAMIFELLQLLCRLRRSSLSSVPLPNQETLSRHSFLGPNGFCRQSQGPSAENITITTITKP